MNIKQYITKQLEGAGMNVSTNSIDRYIAGTRRPTISTAKAISAMLGCSPSLWLDPEHTEQRKKALKVYARKNKMPVYFSPGRPRENNQKGR